MALKTDSFLPLFIADYLADTTHLTRDQDGAYLLLLMAYWRRGGPLPADDNRLMRIAKATAPEWKKLKPVLLEFFDERDGCWHNKRSTIELSKAQRMAEAKAEAGKKGAERRWQTDGTAMAEPLANHMTKNGSLPSPLHPQSPNGDMGGAQTSARPPNQSNDFGGNKPKRDRLGEMLAALPKEN